MSEKTTTNKTAAKRAKKAAGATLILLSLAFLLISVLPKAAGYDAFVIKSDSMLPAIKKGSLVLTKPVSFEDIRTGDILTFFDSHTSGYFTHRVFRVYGDTKQLATKGDANEKPDPKTTHYSCVKGRAVHVLPLIGYPYLAVNSMPGMVLFAAVFIFWAAVEIEAFKSAKKEGVSE